MSDFRNEINEVLDENTKAELKDALADRFGERTTSVNPLTKAMFAELRSGTRPVEYARESDYYSDEMSRVAKNATALKRLLHEQVGRPLYEPVERLRKRDFAECVVAVDAFHEGREYGIGLHTPTTLPLAVSEFVGEPPERSQTPDSAFKVTADLESSTSVQEFDSKFSSMDSPYYVYVLDCTPAIDNEPAKIWDRRRAVQTKVESGVSTATLEPKEQAVHELNQGNRVYYVGSTNNVVKRVREHLTGADKSGVNFTNTLPPRTVVKIKECDSRDSAKSLEGELARQISRKENLFAYSDEK
ncbi:hypothetical protein C5C07_03430 [Haloferax sp. Atlit-4N]|uniref:GIY-YIG nuclease family protein n=1 Tax=Haloferax sp. Atlit-4N TaxID=2077206 RepID=UPI000E22F59B|nr:GIY-YIG nuclease family protein [Haloferax sp. Atlit-4N]RDZ54588.1 hypothetical protein C5C07_03430 [Haloferax sp. Atlit-4N]